MLVRFKMSDVQELIGWNEANTQSPTVDELFEGQYYPDGKVIYHEGDDWPDASKIVSEKLPRCLHLAKDHGLYLVSGTREPLPPKDPNQKGAPRHRQVFAQGCDPRKDEDAFGLADHIFGGDDGSCSIPVEWVKESLRVHPGAQWFIVDIAPERVAHVVEELARDKSRSSGPSL